MTIKFKTIKELQQAVAAYEPRRIGKYWYSDVGGHHFIAESKFQAKYDFESALVGMNQHLYI